MLYIYFYIHTNLHTLNVTSPDVNVELGRRLQSDSRLMRTL